MAVTRPNRFLIQGRVLISRDVTMQYKEQDVPVTEHFLELYNELDRCGLVARLRTIPHYGSIKINAKYDHSRYDYVCQQLTLHDLARKTMKDKHMVLKYGNKICAVDGIDFSLYDAVAILVLISNIGHFRNTFTASQAALRLCRESEAYRESLRTAVDDDRFRWGVDRVIENYSDMQLHLLNALVLLEKCDRTVPCVTMAKELLYMYLGAQSCISDEKKDTLLYVFRQIRDIAFLQSDLPCTAVPMRLITEGKALTTLIQQLLSRFNDTEPARKMLNAIKKLLDDALYHNQTVCFRNEVCIRQMVQQAGREHGTQPPAWAELIMDDVSIFNRKQHVDLPISKDYLKLTFPTRSSMESIQGRVSIIKGVYTTAYTRSDGRLSMLVGISKSCKNKARTAFRVLKVITSPHVSSVSQNEVHLLLATKFFLQHLFAQSNLTIDANDGNTDCLFMARGHKARISKLSNMINMISNKDQQHEADVLRKYLDKDRRNDCSIVIPSSIKVFEENSGKSTAEFDGMVIFPFRTASQIIFFEAKNGHDKKALAKEVLVERLKKLSIPCQEDNIVTVNRDAWYPYSL